MQPQQYSARTAYRPPAPWYRRFNHIGVPLTWLGLAPRDAVTLEVRGRRTGKKRRVPILLTPFQGSQYFVSLSGEAEWVRNLRAAGGYAVVHRRGTRRVRLEELPVAERGRILGAYLERAIQRSGRESAAEQARSYLGVSPEPTQAELDAIAPFYPVFRVTQR